MKLKSLSRIRTDRKCGETTTRDGKCTHDVGYILRWHVGIHGITNTYVCRQHAQIIALRELDELLDEMEELRKEGLRLKTYADEIRNHGREEELL